MMSSEVRRSDHPYGGDADGWRPDPGDGEMWSRMLFQVLVGSIEHRVISTANCEVRIALAQQSCGCPNGATSFVEQSLGLFVSCRNRYFPDIDQKSRVPVCPIMLWDKYPADAEAMVE